MHAVPRLCASLLNVPGGEAAARCRRLVRPGVVSATHCLSCDRNSSPCGFIERLIENFVNLWPGGPSGSGAVADNAKVVSAYAYPRVRSLCGG